MSSLKKVKEVKDITICIKFNGARVLAFLVMCFSGLLAWFNLRLIINIWTFFVLTDKLGEDTNQLLIIYPILSEYALIGVMFIGLVALIKNGFRNLKLFDKSNEEGGLIVGLSTGLIAGLSTGLIAGLSTGLIVGLIAGLIVGLIAGLIVGLIVGLIAGLIVGLIVGLIAGLIEEFEAD